MKKIFYFTGLFLILISAGCNLLKDNSAPDSAENQVLIDFELLTSSPISQQFVDQMLAPFAFLGFDLTSIQEATRYDINIYKLTYYTLYRKTSIIASGAVIVPVTQEVLPILSMQHGSIVNDIQAPSRFTGIISNETNNAVEMTLSFASCGFICSMPDYLGYGASRGIAHPYHIAEYTAQASVDMLKATREFCDRLNINYKNEYFLSGYSEGGYATLALQKKIQLKYQDEFPITASSAGAGAYDLYSTMQYYLNSTTNNTMLLVCYLIMTYHDHYEHSRDLGEIFRSPYKERIENGLLTSDFTYEEIAPQLTPFIDELFTADFIADFTGDGEITLKRAYMANNLHIDWIPNVPTRLYHGTADQLIPAFNSEYAENNFRLNGSTTVTYLPMIGFDHNFGVLFWLIDTLNWFNSLH